MIDFKCSLFGQDEIEYIPELYSHLKSRSLLIPRDAIQANQLRALAIQILKQKEINFSRLDGALAGSICLAMIPDDDEITALRMLQSSAALCRKSLVSGEDEPNILRRRMGQWIALVGTSLCVMYMARISPSIRHKLWNVFTRGGYIVSQAQIWTYLQSLLTKGVLIMSLKACWKDTSSALTLPVLMC